MEARRIDRYQLLEEVGSGGMAVVFRGLDTTLQREVAVKIMHPHLASREESRRRFSREARAVARLRHPSIVEIYDFSDDDTRQSFLVTEFVPGRTLRAFADQEGFGIPELATLAAHGLAEALEHAHANGIIHRDLKPENVMVRSDGQLKLMDFGIARILEGERMTMTGALVGSPLHMAPEIIEGKDAGESADIFALGTILYWMITGEMAFAGNNTTQTLRRILEGQFRDPRTVVPSCSDELAELVGRCLSREPGERPATMTELRVALGEVLLAAGLDRPDETLRAFLLEPARVREELRRALVDRLLAEGEQALAQKRTAKALSIFDRVLALDEGNEKVLAHLERMKRSRVIRRRLQMAGAFACVAMLLGGAAHGLLGGSPGAGMEPAGPAGAIAAGQREPGSVGEEEPSVAQPRSEGESPHAEAAPRDDETAASAPSETSPAGTASELRGKPDGDVGAMGSGGAKATSAAGPGVAQATGPGAPSLPEGSPRPSAEGIGATGGPALEAERPKRPVGSRTVHLRWVPQSAVLTIDGVKVETQAPSWSGELSGGRHTLTLAHPDCCHPWEEVLEIEGNGAPIRRSVALNPRESGWFEVDTDESAAEVWVDGTFKGTVAEVNARGGVPVAFSRNDTGRERYVKTIRFDLLPPRTRTDLDPARAEVVVRAGQRTRSKRIPLTGAQP